jgi:hypothetical protein
MKSLTEQASPFSPKLALEAVLVLGLFGCLTFLVHPLAWVLIPAAAGLFLFVLLARNPNLFFPTLTILVFFQHSFDGSPFSRYLVVWDDILTIVLALSVPFRNWCTLRSTYRRTPLDVAIGFFLLTMLISFILNGSWATAGVVALRNYLLYALVFYGAVNAPVTLRTLRLTFKTVIACFLAQLPILMVQAYLAIQHYRRIYLDADDLQGTFPGANILSYTALFPLFLFLGLKNFRLERLRDKFIALALMGVMILGQGRLSILLFVVILGYLFRRNLFSFRVSLKPAILAATFAAIMVSYFFFTHRSFWSEYDLVWFFGQSEYEAGSGSGRYLYYPLTWNILAQNGPAAVLFGLGPGMYGSLAGFKCMTPMTQYLSNAFHQKEFGMDPFVSSEIIPVWGELGLVGLTAFFFLLIKAFAMARRAYFHTRDPLVRSLSCGLIAGAFLMIVGSYFNPVFEIQPVAYPFWLFAGLLIQAVRLAEEGAAEK